MTISRISSTSPGVSAEPAKIVICSGLIPPALGISLTILSTATAKPSCNAPLKSGVGAKIMAK